MFLHERTKIALCRLGFLACCAAPTALIAACAIWMHSAAYVERVAQQASALSGVEFVIGEVVHPRRGESIWRDVALFDAIHGQQVARAAELHIDQSDNNTRIRAVEGWVSTDLRHALRHSFMRKMARNSPTMPSVWLTAATLRWQNADSEVQLHDVKAGIEAQPEMNQTFLAFRLQADAERGPQMRLVRRNAQPDRYEFELQTYEFSLPCRWFEALGVDLARFGPSAQFGGRISSQWIDGQWHSRAVGRLSNVDLASLLGTDSPHRLTGMAQIHTELTAPIRLRGQRIEQLAATVTAGPGEVSPSLLQAASQHLEMRYVRGQSQAPSGNYLYQQLHLRIQLEQQGLAIQGRCDAHGTVMTDKAGPLVSQPARPKTVAHLVSALAPPSPANMPATAESQRLASFLPAAASEPARRIGARPQPASPSARQ